MVDPSILRDAELLQGLDPAALETIFNAGQVRRIKKRTRIFSQGAPAKSCHLLIEGRTKIVQSGPDGEQVLIHLVGPGEMYGIAAVFLRTGYPADAFAITDCMDLQWSAKTIKELMLTYPCIALNAINIIATRYQDAQHRLREVVHQSVERRIAHAVLRLVQMRVAASVIILKSRCRCCARTWLNWLERRCSRSAGSSTSGKPGASSMRAAAGSLSGSTRAHCHC